MIFNRNIEGISRRKITISAATSFQSLEYIIGGGWVQLSKHIVKPTFGHLFTACDIRCCSQMQANRLAKPIKTKPIYVERNEIFTV